ncbi:PREDICTED: adrenodoxin-like [Nanorana parkeri]|uniref:adrenodoxin-like n=1 Tax=Nanorana parkeri TaxID=125878 RepID=UPI000854C925|nr:PREDICTED: adrenodoxin-like [Nanorana parkeri]
MACHTPKLARMLLGGLRVNACTRNYGAIKRFLTNHIRGFTSSARCQDGKSSSGSTDDHLTVNFINRNGETLTATAKEGESLLEVVIRHHLNIDGFGACEGTLACSTCHLIFDQKHFDMLGAISDEELDMLDLAFGLTDRSRLGCQICMRKAIEGLTVRVPRDVADARGETMGQQSQQ